MGTFKDEWADAASELHRELGGGAALDFGEQTAIPCTMQDLPAGLDVVPGGFLDADNLTVSVAKRSFTGGVWPVEGDTVTLHLAGVDGADMEREKQVVRVAGTNDPALPDLDLTLGNVGGQ